MMGIENYFSILKLPSSLMGEPSTALADLSKLVNLGSSIGCVTVTVQAVSAWPTSFIPLAMYTPASVMAHFSITKLPPPEASWLTKTPLRTLKRNVSH